jgi:hypothetical protein
VADNKDCAVDMFMTFNVEERGLVLVVTVVPEFMAVDVLLVDC